MLRGPQLLLGFRVVSDQEEKKRSLQLSWGILSLWAQTDANVV